MIRIWRRNSCNEYYGTTIHELAHASHCNMDFWNFQITDDVVCESWARGVQLELTRKIYGGYSLENKYSRILYTGIVEDLMSVPLNGSYSKW